MARAGEVLDNPVGGQRIVFRKTAADTSLERFVSAVLAVVGLTVFGHFEERTPKWSRLSKWAVYFAVTGLLARGPGRPWTLAWVLGLPGLGLAFHFWWCRKKGIDPFTAEPKERYYELRGWDPD